MGYSLIIVESPHKAITISGFLGNSYKVIASKGHIKNLPKKQYGIDKKDDKFIASWQLISDKDYILKQLKTLSVKADKIYIATDDDREGERIGWDIIEYLKLKEYYRIVFHEITKKAIEKAINHARHINEDTINAQMARRMIDRIIGYPVSEGIRYYFKKHNLCSYELYKNLGIGRVSAPALKELVNTEIKINKAKVKDYRRVAIDYFHDGVYFRVKHRTIFTEDKLDDMEDLIEEVDNPIVLHLVEQYKRKTQDRKPPPALTTTWMQRAANYLYGFTPEYTMKIAQELYEGINIGNERVGLITYIRTDSKNISEEVVPEIKDYIRDEYGEDYVNPLPLEKENEDKAHEAIRPTSFKLKPENLKKYLSEDQLNLYKFIFLRTIAVFMKSSTYDRSVLTVSVGDKKFHAYANKILFDGWELVGKYWKTHTEDKNEPEEEVIIPSSLYPGMELDPIEVSSYEVEGRKPRHYGVGRFLTTLEKYKIARPSTIATVLPNLLKKQLITIKNNSIYVEKLGIDLIEFLDQYAPWLVDLEKAAEFEKELDMVEKGDYSKDELINKYETLKNEFLKEIEFEKIDYSKKEKLKFFSKCPACKNGKLFETDKTFSCVSRECDFVLFKKNVMSLFEHLGISVKADKVYKYIKAMVESKGSKIYFENIISKKTGREYNAYIGIVKEKRENYDKTFWNLKLSFPKNKNSIPDGIIYANDLLEKDELQAKIEALKEEKRLIVEKAKKDVLTRAYNRKCFDDDIIKIFAYSKTDISLAFVDGDKFKNVNDTYGHDAGDQVLKFLVNKMYDGIRPLQKRVRIYRYGGEEFIMVFVKVSKDEVIECIENIREDIEHSEINHNNQIIKITISVGLSFGKDDDSVETLLKRADTGVYKAKENGRNRIEIIN